MKYECELCGEIINGKNEFKKHLEDHWEEYRCELDIIEAQLDEYFK